MHLADVNPHTITAQAKRNWLVERFWPYFLLTGLLGLLFLALAARGLNLGFVGDVLAYEYHYDRLGIQGGMNWLVTEHWQRHLLGPLYSAPIHFFFPGQSAPWYGFALLSHFANGMIGFLLADTWLRGHYRWLSLAAALAFVVNTLDVSSNFEYPTNTHRNFALSLSLISLWCYLCFVRGGRQNPWWHHVSLVGYVVGFMSYEQTTFLILVFPLIAFFEDKPTDIKWKKWIARVASDLILYLLSLIVYVYLLWLLFPSTSNQLELSLSAIFQQLLDSLTLLLAPTVVWSRSTPSFQLAGLTFFVGSVAFLLIWFWMLKTEDGEMAASFAGNGETRPSTAKLVPLGIAIMVINIASVAPTGWSVSLAPRLLYPAMMGVAYFGTGVLASLLIQFTPRLVRRTIFSGVAAFFVATGVVSMFQAQQRYQNTDFVRQVVLNAVRSAVPSWQGTIKPYILFYSDAHPDDDLGLHGQDINFPYMFDMLYNGYGIVADAIYPDVPASAAPAADLPGSRYIGPYIVVEPEGIFSPLRPGVPIDPDRLVILYYDSQTLDVRIIDELPPDVLATANIVQRAPIEWRTNYSLIGS